jgi:hypothetical protein
VTPLLAFAAALAPAAHAQSCDVRAEVPDQLQVAWISPVGKRVGASATLEVVRVADLRAWIRDHGSEESRVLQGLGILPRGGGAGADWDWKITIFDVKSEWLCRPVEDGDPGEDDGGVAICDEGDAKRLRGHKHGYTGCGYTLDTAASTRGLDVFRVSWESASTHGFCVMPLGRFLGGA